MTPVSPLPVPASALSLVKPIAAEPRLLPLPRASAANGNGPRDAEVLARRRDVERLYAAERAPLTHAMARIVESRADAGDVVQEAFAVLLARTSAPTRAALWGIARDLARERRAEGAVTESYGEDEETQEEAGAWLERVLGG